MPPTNPYLPPGAAVADVGNDEEAGWQPVKLFSWHGRIGRARFIAYSVWGYLITIVAAFVLNMAFLIMGQSLWGMALGLAGLVPYFVLIGFASVQRSHDMGWTGWTTLLMIIPFAVLVWMFKGGDAGANHYGLPPPPNTLSVKIGAWLMPALFIGMIVLSAVSISMYNDVNARAKAAQQRAQ